MINIEKSIKNFEKIFDDKCLHITFNGLDKIIQKLRMDYKNNKITLEKYYTYKNNIENFEKACIKYWELL